MMRLTRVGYLKPLRTRSLLSPSLSPALFATPSSSISIISTAKRSFCATTPPTPPTGPSKATTTEAAPGDKKPEEEEEEIDYVKLNKNNANLPIRRLIQEDDDFADEFDGSATSYIRLLANYLVLGTIAGVVGYAFYSLINESFGPHAPTQIFNRSFSLVHDSDEIMRMTGDPMVAHGMDTGRRSEGRRNIVSSRKYVAGDDSNRTRIRYTAKGPRGKALIYAEVSDKLPGEYVYLIAQDQRSGRVHTIVDNRHQFSSNSPVVKTESSNPLEALLKGYQGGGEAART